MRWICVILVLVLLSVCQMAFAAPSSPSIPAKSKPEAEAEADTNGDTDADTAETADTAAFETQIIKFDNENSGVTGYDFAFETRDGVSRKETATIKNLGTDHEAISVQGTVTWISADGTQYTLKYLADENGYQPEGAHLPVVPSTQ